MLASRETSGHDFVFLIRRKLNTIEVILLYLYNLVVDSGIQGVK